MLGIKPVAPIHPHPRLRERSERPTRPCRRRRRKASSDFHRRSFFRPADRGQRFNRWISSMGSPIVDQGAGLVFNQHAPGSLEWYEFGIETQRLGGGGSTLTRLAGCRRDKMHASIDHGDETGRRDPAAVQRPVRPSSCRTVPARARSWPIARRAIPAAAGRRRLDLDKEVGKRQPATTLLVSTTRSICSRLTIIWPRTSPSEATGVSGPSPSVGNHRPHDDGYRDPRPRPRPRRRPRATLRKAFDTGDAPASRSRGSD